jgi:radical SAM superfamily enzyme YgiQ (UPF0313 family)
VKLVYAAQQFLKTEIPRPDGSLGLLYLAGLLRDHSIDVSVLDMNIGEEGDSLDETYLRRIPIDEEHLRLGMSCDLLKEKLAGCNIVGVTSIFTPQTENALQVAKAAKELNPEILTIVGGGNAGVLHPLFLENGFDIVVCGEGEETLLDICRAYESGEGYDDIPNIAYRNRSGRIVVNPERPVVSDLDELPLPAYDLLPLSKYWEIGEPHGGTFEPGSTVKYLSMQTSRGCPYSCAFCYMSGKGQSGRLRFKSPERVLAEIERIKGFGAEYLFFEDDSLLANRERIMTIFRGLRDSGLKLIGANGVNIAHFYRRWKNGRYAINTDLLDLMLEVGWVEVALGFESGCQRILDKYVSKKWNRDKHDVTALVRTIRDKGLEVNGFFTIGYPDETYDELTQTFLLAQQLVQAGMSSAAFFVVSPMPGSALYESAIAGGYLPADLDLRGMKFAVPSMVNTTIHPEVLRYTRRLAYALIHPQEYVATKDARTLDGRNSGEERR